MPQISPQVEIGTLHRRNGERIHMRVGYHLPSLSISFFNESNERLGFADMDSFMRLINFIYVDPCFRARGYSSDFFGAVMQGLIGGSLTGKKLPYLQVYIRNPLLVGTVHKYGFALSRPYPNLFPEKDPRVEIVVSKGSSPADKILVYAEDPQKRKNLKRFAEVSAEDWHIFKFVDEPIAGERLTIFAHYHLNDLEACRRQILKSGLFFSFIL